MNGRVATFLMTVVARVPCCQRWGPDRRNTTYGTPPKSVPIGLYRLQPIGEPFVTELVAVEPPEPLATFLATAGYLPRGVPMLKRVLALPGQTVCRDNLTITVDSDRAWGSARTRQPRPLPASLAGLSRRRRR